MDPKKKIKDKILEGEMVKEETPGKRGLVERQEMVKEKMSELKKPKDQAKPEAKQRIIPTESMGKAVITTPRISVQRPRTIPTFRKAQTKKTITTPYGKIKIR